MSDALGSAQVFRLDAPVEDAAPRRVTRAATGAHELTALSPALSVAAATPVLASSVFGDRGTQLHALRGAQALRGEPLSAAALAERPAPPAGELAALLRSPQLGDPELRPYRPWPQLDRVGTPALIAGASREGSFAVGGASLLFSDMLGNHVIGANLVRGYESGSFESDECEPDAFSECPTYDRLLGSRILVGNLELRFPLLGYERARRIPVEAALFSDIGWAWTRDADPSFLSGERDPVLSYGAALRFALFGTGAVFELAAAHPRDRPDSHRQLLFTLHTGL